VHLGFWGLFGAGLRFGFDEVVVRVRVVDGFSLGVRCLLVVSLRVLGDAGVRDVPCCEDG
jgi:hypothetical protein